MHRHLHAIALGLWTLSLVGCATDSGPGDAPDTAMTPDAVSDALDITDGTEDIPDRVARVHDVVQDTAPSEDTETSPPETMEDTSAQTDVAADGGGPLPADTLEDVTPDPVGHAHICLNPIDSGYPSTDYDTLVVNGSWNEWAGSGVILEGPDGDGFYCGTLSNIAPGTYEFVFSATGSADAWSGWGPVGNAPINAPCGVDNTGNFALEVVADETVEVCHRWNACDCDPAADGATGSALICMDPSGSGYPSESYSTLLVNGTWNGWNGWGLILGDDDGDGLYCGVLDDLAPGDYEYVHAATGSWDNWAGWGQAGNAPLGSECDATPDDEWGNFGFTVVADETVEVCHGWEACGCDDPDTGATTGSVEICVDTGDSGYPSAEYDNLVVNGSWNDWGGWGLIVEDPDGDGVYCGILGGLSPGNYEYVHAATGVGDEWGGWGKVGNAPLGSACDINPTDEYGNFGFFITAGETVTSCHGWSSCGCGDPVDPVDPIDPVDPVEGQCADAPGREVPITVVGRQILVGDTPIHMKGVAWSPTPIGQGPGGGGTDFAGYVEEDAALMKAAGINVLRTYGPIHDTAVLDTLWEHGISVLMTVFYGYSDTVDSAVDHVCALKEHPAILAWVVGNEWNYNNLGTGVSFTDAVATVGEVVAAIQANDATRPVSTIYGWLPTGSVLDSLSHVDIWGLNVYTGISFDNVFNDWEGLSDKPMYFGEYGMDAYNGLTNQVDESAQATCVQALTAQIHANASVNDSGVCAGGMVFEFNDEWWKYTGGSWWEHDTVKSWDNGSYSDPFMHEEWWGLVDIDRNTRAAYDAFAAMDAPTP